VKRAAAALLALLFCAPALAQDRVVLVAAAGSPLQTLSSFEVRKIYLGITVFKDGRPVRGLRNATDPRLNGVFLQAVIGLSAESYERRLLTNVFKFGTARPAEISDPAEIARTLAADPYAVTYVWVSDGLPEGLKELRVLWQDF
jgi:hypothetical protein